jgi:hypothetical protein
LKDDGGAESYRNVEIKYVRGQQCTLRIFRNGREIDTVVISTLPNKERMHAAMVQHGFEKKSDEELQIDFEKAQRRRQAQNLALFHRHEYVRIQHLYAHLFRRDVMRDVYYDETSYVGGTEKYNAWLHRNYDTINKGMARTGPQLYGYAVRYLESLL